MVYVRKKYFKYANNFTCTQKIRIFVICIAYSSVKRIPLEALKHLTQTYRYSMLTPTPSGCCDNVKTRQSRTVCYNYLFCCVRE